MIAMMKSTLSKNQNFSRLCERKKDKKLRNNVRVRRLPSLVAFIYYCGDEGGGCGRGGGGGAQVKAKF